MNNKCGIRIVVMSRSEFVEYAIHNHSETSAVVSISSIDEGSPAVKLGTENNIRSVQFISFDDTDGTVHGCKAITDMQAKSIADFIKNNIHKVDRLIVHCGAGQSRSAGVAAAILKYFTDDDSLIFNNPKYTPNMLCYRKVLEALMDNS